MPLTPNSKKAVAYFCMEYAVHQPLKIYSGGLGYLASSFMRSAYELRFMLTPTEIIKINPDVIILDYYLPNGHGDKLCLELKSNLPTKNTPVILMPAHNSLRNISKECDADAYLEKPFDLNKLIQVVTQYATV